jgi:hypothetical protein
MTSKASTRNPSRRPKLMRASATCPQLATSNASRKDLATIQPYGATTILERALRSPYGSPDQRSPESASVRNSKEVFDDLQVVRQCESLSFPSSLSFLLLSIVVSDLEMRMK